MHAVTKRGMVPSDSHEPAALNNYLTHCNMITIRKKVETCCQSQQQFYQHHRPSLSWSDANVKQPAPQTDVHAEIITCSTRNVKTMKTVTPKLLIAMMKMLDCKLMKLLVCNLQKVSI